MEDINFLSQSDPQIEHLAESYKELQNAKQKFKESLEAVQIQKELPNGKEILVPLTGSMYVPGQIIETNKFLIDIGTQYLVERDAEQSVGYFERKIEFIDVQLAKFSEMMQARLMAKKPRAAKT